MSLPTIGDLFRVAAEREKVAVAVLDDGRPTTYAQLGARVRVGASALRKDLGLVRPLALGDRAVILAGNGGDFLAAVLSCATAGVVAVPMSTQLTAHEIAYILENCCPSLILCDQDHDEVVREALEIAQLDTAPKLLAITALGCGGSAVTAAGQVTDVTPDDLLYLGYTSGTTGRPQGVRVTHRNRVHAVLLQAAEFQLGRGQTHLIVSPLYHTAPLTFALLHLCLGGTVAVHKTFDAGRTATELRSGRVSSVFLAPAALRRVLAAERSAEAPPPQLHAVIIGGSPCPVDVKSSALTSFPGRLYEFYGATEVGIVTSLRPEQQAQRPSSVGQLIPGTAVEIRDLAGTGLLPQGEVGAVWVSTATGCDGYFGPGDLPTADRWSCPGDVGYLDEEGYLHLVDRSTDIIISGGVNVYSREVEAVLEGHPAVSDIAVLGVPDPEWGEAVAAAVVLAPGASASEDELTSFCRDQLAPYKRPKQVLFFDALPRSEAGKTDKRALRDRFAEATEPVHP